MKKTTLYAIITVAIILVVIINLSFMGNKTGSNSETSLFKTEKERYVEFEADFACQVLGIQDTTEMMAILNGFPELAAEHGFTEQEVNSNIQKYKNDSEFKQLAFESMKEQCPAKIEAAGLTNFALNR